MSELGPLQPLQADPWRKLRLECSRSEFVAAHPYPFLVRVPGLGGGWPQTSGLQQVSFHTVVQPSLPARPSMGALANLDASPLELLVFPVRKAPDNPFPERISLGRAPNCDVSVRDGSISKLHGHFCDVTPSAAAFVDAKSANGTRVEGRTLEPGERCLLSAGAYVSFGRVRLQLVDAAQLYDQL